MLCSLLGNCCSCSQDSLFLSWLTQIIIIKRINRLDFQSQAVNSNRYMGATVIGVPCTCIIQGIGRNVNTFFVFQKKSKVRAVGSRRKAASEADLQNRLWGAFGPAPIGRPDFYPGEIFGNFLLPIDKRKSVRYNGNRREIASRNTIRWRLLLFCKRGSCSS